MAERQPPPLPPESMAAILRGVLHTSAAEGAGLHATGAAQPPEASQWSTIAGCVSHVNCIPFTRKGLPDVQ